jgi:type III restriction enzyme
LKTLKNTLNGKGKIMLTEIKDLQKSAVNRLTAEIKKKTEVTFKAPTGSGKTYMMADLINGIIAENKDIVFIVSSLSKGGLARQNYEKFCEYSEKKFFENFNPYLINSEIAGEERLYIPPAHNVYFLPRDLYKKGGRLMQGAMEAFLQNITNTAMLGGQEKKVILIKDECHIATKNLDDISGGYFANIINFSATPKLSRGQTPDAQITESEAVNAKLIKSIEWGEETDSVEDAINKFEAIKDNYRNKLGVNPCLIIQISNKDKAEHEWNNTIKPILDKKQDLKWMMIVDKEKECDTNDVFKAKKMSVSKWKDYAKEAAASIDIIIFKMVITEGWDIPRACMLYQVRDTKSKQLDEQVMGRVRRNPRLLDFETLDEESQKLALTAWVWGIAPESERKFYAVKLKSGYDIANNIKIKTTKLKPLTEKAEFDLQKYLKEQKEILHHKSIFELGRKLKQANNEVRNIVYDYAVDYAKWRQAAEFIDDIEKENEKYICDYKNSMEIAEETSFALTSHYTDSGNYVNIANWVWKRRDESDKFAFDSEAEREWADILKDLSNQNFAKIEKRQGEIFEDEKVFLWGKNYIPNSTIKFEYYMNALRSSYPDFVMKDAVGKIHIFEVKSVNEGYKIGFDSDMYKAKITALKSAYKQASKLTG